MKRVFHEEKTKRGISKFQTLNSKFHSGITLIALVVTIVVLLILAGVTITLMFGENNIFDLAKDAAEKTNQAVKDDLTQIDELNKWLTGSDLGDDTVKIPEHLTVGSYVIYEPNGTYLWDEKYATSNSTEVFTLDSRNRRRFLPCSSLESIKYK